MASPEGVRLLRYELLREIGRGATSTVYLARDQVLGLELALKVLHPQLAASDRSEVCRRFFHEARVLAALHHPAVVFTYDVDEAARTLAMEYLPGGTLRDRLRAIAITTADAGGGLPATVIAAEAGALARGLLGALEYLHGHGVVHGDITPRNVLLRRPGAPVLVDFGNARLLVAALSMNPAAGTPLYLAPKFRGAATSALTDLFAVGAILWEMVAGRPLREHADLLGERLAATPLPQAVGKALRPGDQPLVHLIEALTAGATLRPPTAEAALRLLGN